MLKRIVSIEDEIEISELLVAVLDHPALQIAATLSAYEGIDAINDIRPDLVILDIMLPDLDGWTVYENLRAEPSLDAVPVIMLTVLRREFQQPRLRQLAAIDRYMTKPFDPLQLRHTVEASLGVALWP